MENKFIDYFTERDLIQRYADKRKNMTYEESEDLYRAIIKYILFKLEDPKAKKMGIHLRGFGSFLNKRLKIDNLRKSPESPQFKQAQEQLHHWLSGHQRLKIEN